MAQVPSSQVARLMGKHSSLAPAQPHHSLQLHQFPYQHWSFVRLNHKVHSEELVPQTHW